MNPDKNVGSTFPPAQRTSTNLRLPSHPPPTLDPHPKRRLDRGMKAILFALFVALLMVGCGEQAQKEAVEGESEEKRKCIFLVVGKK